MTIWTASLVANHGKEGGYFRVADNWVRRTRRQICVQSSPDTESGARAVSCQGCDVQADGTQLRPPSFSPFSEAPRELGGDFISVQF